MGTWIRMEFFGYSSCFFHYILVFFPLEFYLFKMWGNFLSILSFVAFNRLPFYAIFSNFTISMFHILIPLFFNISILNCIIFFYWLHINLLCQNVKMEKHSPNTFNICCVSFISKIVRLCILSDFSKGWVTIISRLILDYCF